MGMIIKLVADAARVGWREPDRSNEFDSRENSGILFDKTEQSFSNKSCLNSMKNKKSY